MSKEQLIDKYIEKIKSSYPEDDKLMIDLNDLLREVQSLQLQQSQVGCQSELLIALQNIEKICDNQNPTHEQIWIIAYDAITNHRKHF